MDAKVFKEPLSDPGSDRWTVESLLRVGAVARSRNVLGNAMDLYATEAGAILTACVEVAEHKLFAAQKRLHRLVASDDDPASRWLSTGTVAQGAANDAGRTSATASPNRRGPSPQLQPGVRARVLMLEARLALAETDVERAFAAGHAAMAEVSGADDRILQAVIYRDFANLCMQGPERTRAFAPGILRDAEQASLVIGLMNPLRADIVLDRSLCELGEGRVDAALAHLRAVVGIYGQVYGMASPRTAAAYGALGIVACEMGRDWFAYYKQEMQALFLYSRQVLPNATSAGRSAPVRSDWFLFDNTGPTERLAWLHRCLDLQRRIYGRDHFSVINTLLHLAAAYHEMGEPPQCETFALAARVKSDVMWRNDRHPLTARANFLLGLSARAGGDWTKARHFFAMSLAVRVPLYTNYKGDLGRLYQDDGGAVVVVGAAHESALTNTARSSVVAIGAGAGGLNPGAVASNDGARISLGALGGGSLDFSTGEASGARADHPDHAGHAGHADHPPLGDAEYMSPDWYEGLAASLRGEDLHRRQAYATLDAGAFGESRIGGVDPLADSEVPPGEAGAGAAQQPSERGDIFALLETGTNPLCVARTMVEVGVTCRAADDHVAAKVYCLCWFFFLI